MPFQINILQNTIMRLLISAITLKKKKKMDRMDRYAVEVVECKDDFEPRYKGEKKDGGNAGPGSESGMNSGQSGKKI